MPCTRNHGSVSFGIAWPWWHCVSRLENRAGRNIWMSCSKYFLRLINPFKPRNPLVYPHFPGHDKQGQQRFFLNNPHVSYTCQIQVLTAPLQVYNVDGVFREVADVMHWTTTGYWLLDVPMSFLTAVYIHDILHSRLIDVAKVYIKFWFWCLGHSYLIRITQTFNGLKSSLHAFSIKRFKLQALHSFTIWLWLQFRHCVESTKVRHVDVGSRNSILCESLYERQR